ncbi:fimbrial protein [Burkholderia multivorans]|uniref:fimbria/pilus outer membrane usher protein n=1 Tax=Burkholderia multivorans TaxID=87883 RepID=UPI00075D7118|nr:fimbria/pilus outer membrane usher protein [Burkholderia multivorans]KVV21524.1 fimbrial protein [Burkholderia multivorans]MBU9203733.1 fimbrial biogenesis outer membrane usher protein [Burkholderia multivorans]MCA8388108.1 fimbrial biogenesis outer membrane usher protein [Burkholderia multivorans]MCO8355413.1 fimbrial biogenesis outer membrane usher protein [Burkholderia multivorans]MCO8388854.1 fimbrial biogenesis outer membrane usher protein [Burkholderia multivorans]
MRKSIKSRARWQFALKPSHACVLAALGGVAATHAGAAAAAEARPAPEVRFSDTLLLKGQGQRIDVSRFGRGNPVAPGEYTVDIALNGKWIGRSALRFVGVPGSDSAVLCVDAALATRVAFDDAALTDAGRAELAKIRAGECGDFALLADGASYRFDQADFRLELTVPQAALQRQPRGYVSPELWDAGIPSATLKYNFNTYRSSSFGHASNMAYLGLNGGINVAGWHLRHTGSYAWNTGSAGRYDAVSTYVQRDLPALHSQVTLGEVFTDGSIFDSVGLRGVTIATDDRMLPDSQRGYAPLVRGVANSNAHVKISQNGNTLYETNVPPGAFEINDLYPTGYGGDLLVTVTEANGSTRSFTVPYASVSQSLREGNTRFSVALGQFREQLVDAHPNFAQATIQHGFSNLFTGYAGAIAARGYVAGLVGSAFNTQWGAFAVDFTQAKAEIPGAASTTGQSARITYSKLVPATDTSIAIAAYRYSSRGFWTARNAIYARSLVASGRRADDVARERSQLQLTVSQNLGARWGNAYAIGSMQNYWNQPGSTTSVQLGYSNTLKLAGHNLSYNLSFSRQRSGFAQDFDNQLYASLTIPLGKSVNAPTLSASLSRDTRGGSSQLIGLNGSAGENGEFSYSVTGNRSPGSLYGGGTAQYRAPFASLSAGASGGSGQSQFSAGLSGALVAHSGGITFANDLGETAALVEARDAKGARVTNGSGIRIDGRGYAIVPSLSPYILNTISIDPKGIPLDVELQSTSRQVAPRANALVAVRFATATGRAALITARLPDGKSLPFGTHVFDSTGANVGVIAQSSHLFVRGIPESGVLTAKWGNGPQDACSFSYRLPTAPRKDAGYARVDAICGGGALADAPSYAIPLSSRTAIDDAGDSAVPTQHADTQVSASRNPSATKEISQ